MLFEVGKPGAGMFVILSGRVSFCRRDAFGRSIPIWERGPGHFLAEVGQISGADSLVDVRAIGPVEALLVPAGGPAGADGRGDRARRAHPPRPHPPAPRPGGTGLRRPGARRPPHQSPDAGAPGVPPSQRLPARGARPGDRSRCRGSAQSATRPGPTICRSSSARTDRCSGIRATSPSLAISTSCPTRSAIGATTSPIVGAGPAGLSTAVYGASEGLSVLVIDCPGLRGPGRRQRADRQLLRFPRRGDRAGSHRTRLHPGPEVRGGVRHAGGRHPAVLWLARGAPDLRCPSSSRTGGPSPPGRWSSPPVRATADQSFPPWLPSRDGACPTGPRRSRHGSAGGRTWSWSAAETPPDRRRCTSPGTPPGC